MKYKTMGLFVLCLLVVFNLWGIKEEEIINVSYKEIDMACIQFENKVYLLKTNKEYNDLKKNKSLYSGCDNFVFPFIDFDNELLVGVVCTYSGCSQKNIISTLNYDTNKNYYEFLLKIEKEGECKMLNHLSKWFLIPKLKENDSINIILKIN